MRDVHLGRGELCPPRVGVRTFWEHNISNTLTQDVKSMYSLDAGEARRIV